MTQGVSLFRHQQVVNEGEAKNTSFAFLHTGFILHTVINTC